MRIGALQFYKLVKLKVFIFVSELFCLNGNDQQLEKLADEIIRWS